MITVAEAFRLFPQPLLRAMGAGDPVAIAAFSGYIDPFVKAEVATWPLWTDLWRQSTLDTTPQPS